MMPDLTFILGGASSGKSSYAEALVVAADRPKVYVATSRVYDDEMRQKVQDHIADRGAGWITVEEPLDMAKAMAGCRADQIVLLDCATMWLTNVIMDDMDVAPAIAAFLKALSDAPCPVVVVSNEIGLGIVPENALARRFRIAQGQLNAAIAARADVVALVAAGLPIALKGTLPG